MQDTFIKNADHLPGAVDLCRWNTLGRLLFIGDQVFTARVEARMRARGYRQFRGSVITVVRAMRIGGSRIGDLAARARMTPQGMSQLVSSLSRKGLLRISVDGEDRRARLVVYTAKGERMARAAAEAVEQVEAEFRASAGAGEFETLRSLLSALIDNLPETKAYALGFLTEADPKAPGPSSGPDPSA